MSNMRTMNGIAPEFSQKRSGAYFTPPDVSAALVACPRQSACLRSATRRLGGQSLRLQLYTFLVAAILFQPVLLLLVSCGPL